MFGTTTQRVWPAIASTESTALRKPLTLWGSSLVPSAKTIAAGSPPRLRTIETPSGRKREIETDWLTFQPGSAPGRYGFVPSPSESPTAKTARSRTTSLSRSTERPFANQASLYLPAPSTSKRVRESWPGLWVWRSRQCLRSPALRKQSR